jgi:hypothetical protein
MVEYVHFRSVRKWNHTGVPRLVQTQEDIMDDASGIPWIFIHLGWVVLGAALVYGIVRSRRMRPGEKAAQQRAAHDNFRVDEDSA